MTTIATRAFELHGFKCVETVSRTGEQSFVLQFTTYHLAEQPCARPMMLTEAFEWLRDQLRRIVREVVMGK